MNTDQFIDGYVEDALQRRAAERDGREDPTAPLIANLLRERLDEMRPYLDRALSEGVTVDQFIDGYIAYQENARVKGPAGSREDTLTAAVLADLTRRQLDYARPHLEQVFGR